jgi:hypothetical protein
MAELDLPKTVLSLCNFIIAELAKNVTTILIACLVLLIYKYRWSHHRFTKQLPNTNRLLLVIAHPDDEVMFFGPVLINLIKQMKNRVYILCLSPGKSLKHVESKLSLMKASNFQVTMKERDHKGRLNCGAAAED